MEVKTFLIEEHKEMIFDAVEIEDWKHLVEELGLEEQKKLIQEESSPIPFPVMTEAEAAIYREVLSNHTDYKKFGNEAIPIKILSIIALCEKERYFDKIEIWHDQTKNDPYVVGLRYPDQGARERHYDWNMVTYSLGQWGPKLLPVTELLPLWDKAKREEIQSTHEYQIREHEKRMAKFEFQLKAKGQ